MKKIKVFLVILISVFIILMLIPVSFAVVDRVRFNNGEAPIFAKDRGAGCEQIIIEGIGYSIITDCPETTIEDTTVYAPSWKWFWEG